MKARRSRPCCSLPCALRTSDHLLDSMSLGLRLGRVVLVKRLHGLPTLGYRMPGWAPGAVVDDADGLAWVRDNISAFGGDPGGWGMGRDVLALGLQSWRTGRCSTMP